MNLEIFINNERLDLYSDKKLNYNIQANDLAEIGKFKVSFSNSYAIPRTERNTKIFNGLGLVGDSSRIKYNDTMEVECRVKGYSVGNQQLDVRGID